MKSKRILLWTIIGLILANSLFLASAINVIVQSFFFSSGRFAFQFDDTKLVVDRVGDFKYDSEGKLEELTVYVKNKDSDNAYSGYIEVMIDSQKYKVDVSLNGGQTKGFDIDVEPHLAISGPLVINVNVIIAGAGAADLIAQKGTAIADSGIDGTMGTEWNDAKSYTNVPISPSGTANIWVKNDGTNLYIALQFTADSNNLWVAFQMGATGCMDAGADGALFGNNHDVTDGYTDIKFDGTGPVKVDVTIGGSKNGVGTIAVGAGNLVTIELKKPLSSGDSTGGDIAWVVGNTYSLVVAWDTNTTNHKSATPISRTILVGA